MVEMAAVGVEEVERLKQEIIRLTQVDGQMKMEAIIDDWGVLKMILTRCFFFRSLIKQAQTKSSLPSMDWSCLKRRRGWRRDARYLGDDHDGIDDR